MASKKHKYTDKQGKTHEIFETTDGEGGRMFIPQKEDDTAYGAATESLESAQKFIEKSI